MPTQSCHGRIIFSVIGQKKEEAKEEDILRRKIFGKWGRRRRKRRKMGKLLHSRPLEIEGSRRGPCRPKNWTSTIQGNHFETVTKRRNYLLRPKYMWLPMSLWQIFLTTNN